MKFTKAFLFLALIYSGIACSKEDTPEPTPTDTSTPVTTNEVIGTWKATDINYSGSSTTSMAGYSVTSDFTGTGYDLNLSITFTDNPKNYSSSGDYSIKLVTTTQGQTYTNNWTNQGFIDGGTWTKENDLLAIVSQNSQAQEVKIVELTATTLKLGYTTTTTTEQDGVTVTNTINGTYSFQRQ